MATWNKELQLILAISLPFLAGLACTERSRLDRGDANQDRLLNRSGERYSDSQASADGTAGEDAAGLHAFAAPPGSPGSSPNQRPAEESSPPASNEGKGRGGFSHGAAPVAPSAAPANRSAKARTADSAERSRDSATWRREERPGLGTSWGETRSSWSSSVTFDRESLNAPWSTERIYYNDVRGILAQSGEYGTDNFGANYVELGSGFVTVEIVDPDGNPFLGLTKAGRNYVIGRDGERYAIRIRNQRQFRVEVVATVDGLDVIDGRTGSLAKRGYVIDPYGTVVIEGFRRSTTAVAAFRFGAVSDSYAARTNTDRNVGVVGLALFRERGCCVDEYGSAELNRRESADPFPGQYASPPRPKPLHRAF